MSVLSIRRPRLRTLRGRPKPPVAVVITYGFMAVVLLAYLLFLVANPSRAQSTLIGGWGVVLFELAGGFICIAAGRRRTTARAIVPVVLGTSLIAWALGDLALTVESLGGAMPPVPSVADVFYLSFFPLAYVALVLMVRGEVRHLSTPNWLDGAVAGFGAATFCAAFAFHAIDAVGGARRAEPVQGVACGGPQCARVGQRGDQRPAGPRADRSRRSARG